MFKSVHPRACGEQSVPMKSRRLTEGSSPRVRGTVRPDRVRQPQARFIPARAGNRRRYPLPSLPCPVHPRACGEQAMTAGAADITTGSSPRVRGTALLVCCRSRSRRFIPAACGEQVLLQECVQLVERSIPARAGNSELAVVSGIFRPVHPRACGEQTGSCGAKCCSTGASPRVRGTGRCRTGRPGTLRFIPARAGNSR